MLLSWEVPVAPVDLSFPKTIRFWEVRWQGTGAKLHYRKGVLIMCLYYRHGQLRGIHSQTFQDL